MRLRPDTLLQHGDSLPDDDSSVAPPIHPSATYAAADAAEFARMAGEPRHPRYYTRYGNPTQQRVAQLIASLEGGETALMTASGMGAISAVMLGMLRAGDHVVTQVNHYMGTTKLVGELLARFGVLSTQVDQASSDAFASALTPSTRLILTETPANPTLTLTDLAAVAALARPRGIITVCDNTFAGPLNQRPLDLGIDLVVHSATKSLGGHHDLMAGVVVGRQDLIDHVWDSAIVLGSVLGAHDAWLLLRGLRTLSVRNERANRNAQVLATFLQSHPAVERVHYPGLADHPQHALAVEQMKGFGSVMAVQVRGGYRETEAFMSKLQVFTQAVSLGGVESLAVHAAAMWAGTLSDDALVASGIQPNLVRLSVGLEDDTDLIEDLDQALRG